jgi:uncharacterized protein
MAQSGKTHGQRRMSEMGFDHWFGCGLRAAAIAVLSVGFVIGDASQRHAQAASNGPGQCRGQDMLAELQTDDPDLHARVISEAAALSNTEAVLWKIERPGLAPSHLFGTMHLSDDRIAKLSPAVAAAIKSSSTVALEVADLSESAVAAAMVKAADMIIFTDGRSLQSLLEPDEFERVKSVVTKSGMPGEFAGVFKPWLINMLLALSDCERRNVSAGAAVLDMKVAEAAQKNGAAVVGLETIQEQLGALAAVPDDQQVQMLRVGLKYADRADDMVETLVQLYLRRQLGAAMPFQVALAARHDTPASAFDGFKTSLLVDRNAKMRDAALPLLEKGSAFIAVGALHLPGPTGLVQLFRDAGYTVSAVE